MLPFFLVDMRQRGPALLRVMVESPGVGPQESTRDKDLGQAQLAQETLPLCQQWNYELLKWS